MEGKVAKLGEGTWEQMTFSQVIWPTEFWLNDIVSLKLKKFLINTGIKIMNNI
jgi:hypothetical protein